MAIYDAYCPRCNRKQEYVSRIDERLVTPPCLQCGGPMTKAVTTCQVPIMSMAETLHVVSPIDGEILRDRYSYEKHMAKHNVRPASEFEGVKKVEPKLDREKLAQAVSEAYDQHIGS